MTDAQPLQFQPAATPADSAEDLARADPEVDAGHPEVADCIEDLRGVRHHVGLVVGRVQRAGPAVEHLRRLRARFDL